MTVNLPPVCQSIWAMAILFDFSILPWSNKSLVMIYAPETCDPSKLQFRSFSGHGLGSSSLTNFGSVSMELQSKPSTFLVRQMEDMEIDDNEGPSKVIHEEIVFMDISFKELLAIVAAVNHSFNLVRRNKSFYCLQ